MFEHDILLPEYIVMDIGTDTVHHAHTNILLCSYYKNEKQIQTGRYTVTGLNR